MSVQIVYDNLLHSSVELCSSQKKVSNPFKNCKEVDYNVLYVYFKRKQNPFEVNTIHKRQIYYVYVSRQKYAANNSSKVMFFLRIPLVFLIANSTDTIQIFNYVSFLEQVFFVANLILLVWKFSI